MNEKFEMKNVAAKTARLAALVASFDILHSAFPK
jgi:hypothetical protein